MEAGFRNGTREFNCVSVVIDKYWRTGLWLVSLSLAYVSLSADKIVESNLDTQTLVSTLNHATAVKTVMLKIVN